MDRTERLRENIFQVLSEYVEESDVTIHYITDELIRRAFQKELEEITDQWSRMAYALGEH